MFPEGLRLSALTEFETACSPRWEAADLDRLVSSCSHVQKLSLHCTLGLQLSVLSQLNNLMQLWLSGETDSSMMASLSHLTALHRLQRLAVTDNCKCNGSFFLPLTALTQLTYLALPHHPTLHSSMQQRLLQLWGKTVPDVDRRRWPTEACSVITSTVSEHARGGIQNSY